MLKQLLLLSTLWVVLTTTACAQTSNTGRGGVAIRGYDPVSYFDSAPQMGSKAFTHHYEGATYWFSSAQNQQRFIDHPAAFVPQYGGWCAYAMGVNGDLVKINPERYKLIDDKLYLFYDFGKTNTLKLWNEAEGQLLPKADANWAILTK